MKNSKVKSEKILRNYQKEAEQILYKMLKILEREQKKAENATYKKMLEEVNTHASK